MFSQFILKNIARSFWRCLTASALLLFLSVPLQAAPEAILRLDPGGHSSTIRDLLVTTDGILVTASKDKTIRIWNPNTGREEGKILGQIGPGSEGMLYAIALSPEGSLLVSGGFLAQGYGVDDDKVGQIRLHNFQSGELLQILKGHENVVFDLAFSKNGRWLASGS